jgi:hypothetical protein
VRWLGLDIENQRAFMLLRWRHDHSARKAELSRMSAPSDLARMQVRMLAMPSEAVLDINDI